MPNSGPGGVPSMPGGYRGCAMKPMARVESAVPGGIPEIGSPSAAVVVPSLYTTAVRAFCAATSKLNRVLSGGRKPPRTLPAVSTTMIVTWAVLPSGMRIPARSGFIAAMPCEIIVVTSEASSLTGPGSGLSMKGYMT